MGSMSARRLSADGRRLRTGDFGSAVGGDTAESIDSSSARLYRINCIFCHLDYLHWQRFGFVIRCSRESQNPGQIGGVVGFPTRMISRQGPYRRLEQLGVDFRFTEICLICEIPWLIEQPVCVQPMAGMDKD